MTRILSELLGAREPAFQQGLSQLERAGGGVSEDIRLTADILRGSQQRLKALGLDPHDTTGRELYAALMQRIREDNRIFEDHLAGVNGSIQLTAAVVRFIDGLSMKRQVFAVKQAVVKRLIRRTPPKRAMKALGYRSLESMLKHEQSGLIMTAAHLVEPAAWHKAMQQSYKKLQPGDFECRDISLLAPANGRWENLARDYVSRVRQNIVGHRELGIIVLLPLPADRLTIPQASALAMTLLTLQAMNDITSASSYLKMHQVRADFGAVVAAISRNEPLTSAEIAGTSLPWKLVHRYFAGHPEAYNPDIFEPHVQREDLRWHAAEDVLGEIHPRFDFWHGAGYTGLLSKGETVSLNIIDSVLNFCNQLPYEQRMVRYVRGHIWQELLMRYMRQSGIERNLHRQLSDELLA